MSLSDITGHLSGSGSGPLWRLTLGVRNTHEADRFCLSQTCRPRFDMRHYQRLAQSHLTTRTVLLTCAAYSLAVGFIHLGTYLMRRPDRR